MNKKGISEMYMTKLRQNLRKLQGLLSRNLWRLWGMLSLGYIVLWFYALFTWYFPKIQAPTGGILMVSWTEAVMAVLFCTVGIMALIFAFLVLWVTLKR